MVVSASSQSTRFGENVARFKCSIVFVDDDPSLVRLAQGLLSQDYDFRPCATAEEAQLLLARQEADIVISDQQLPGLQGIPFLEWVQQHRPRAVRILMTGVYSMEEAVDSINSGLTQRFLFKPWRPDQLIKLVRNSTRSLLLERSHENLLEELRRLTDELESRVESRTRELQASHRQLEQKNAILERMALSDPLTGLPNRRAMDRLAKTELVRRARSGAPLAIGLVDADFFKDINTKYLHSGGDHVLKWLADTLQNSIRTIDTVGRVGGEEFMIVAPETDLEGARVLAERIRETVERSYTTFNNETIKITVSVGMVVADQEYVGYDPMRHQVASLLSEAKRTGRNRCIVRQMQIQDEPMAIS